jgi:probable HAF family extracellular repeat protein
VDLGTLGGSSSYAVAISDNGAVVGWSETKSGDTHAFLWKASRGMVDLGTLAGERSSQAVAVLDGSLSTDTQVLGVSGASAVVWSGTASVSVLPVPVTASGTVTYPQGFNDRGEVVGFDTGVNLGQRAWIWSASDGKSDLSSAVQTASTEGNATAINSAGVALLSTNVSTCSRNSECWRSYLWTKSSGFLPLGVPDGDAETSVTGLALNDQRTVVGWTGRSGAVSAYRWTAATGFTVLSNYPSAMYGYAAGVNAIGNAVGAALEPASGSIVATLWPARGGIQRLSPQDGNPSVALAINSSSAVAGWASVASGVNHAVIWVPTSQLTNQQSSAWNQAPSDASLTAHQTESAQTASAGCLKRLQSLRSRQALFTCVLEADRAALVRSR